jgi:hypothetical protein
MTWVGRVADRAHLAVTWPWYPCFATAAILIALFTNTGSPWPALWRPLVIAVVIILLAQLALTLVIRQRHIAAVTIFILGLYLVGFGQAALALIVAVDLLALVRRFRFRDWRLPWAELTRLGNTVAAVGLVVVAVNAGASGHYWPAGLGPLPTAAEGAPDVYLILLDGHPRLDTLRTHFGVDTTPFVEAMTARGFVESAAAHSNYNLTFLTLASMFNGAQIDDLVPDPPKPGRGNGSLLILNKLINASPEVDRFHDAGYEIVSIASPFTQAALEHADRYLDNGGLTDFELALLRKGELPKLFADQLRAWHMEDHRARVLSTFDHLEQLAAERVDHPRFVFAHILSPHAPVAFAADGSAVPGLDCYPVDCALWDGGERYGDRAQVQAAQIQYLDERLEKTVEAIQAKAARPPVIVVFSDHGHRHDLNDQVESLRSFLMAATPGKSDVFPADSSPVNLLTRLENAYLGTALPMSTEDGFFIDVVHLSDTGAFAYQPVPITSESP